MSQFLLKEKAPWWIEKYFFKKSRLNQEISVINQDLSNKDLPPETRMRLQNDLELLIFERDFEIKDRKNLRVLIDNLLNQKQLRITKRDIKQAYKFLENENGTIRVREFTKKELRENFFWELVSKSLLILSFLILAFIGVMSFFPSLSPFLRYTILITLLLTCVTSLASLNPTFPFQSARKISKAIQNNSRKKKFFVQRFIGSIINIFTINKTKK